MKEILESYKVPELKRIVRATNIIGYSKLKKDELIKLMMRPEHADRFKDLKMKGERILPKGKKVVKQLKSIVSGKPKTKKGRERLAKIKQDE